MLEVQAASRLFYPEILQVRAVSRALPPEILQVVQAESINRGVVLAPKILSVQAESEV